MDSDLLVATIFASVLSFHGLRKKSLSPSGAATAFVVGILAMAGGLWAFDFALIVFYLLGSRATKYGKQRKAKLEEGYTEAGFRSGWQVLCNSCWGVLAVVAWNGIYMPSSIQARLTGGLLSGYGDGRVYVGDAWCAVGEESGWSRRLVFAALGHFGCCLGDTLASELGILSKGEPRLVTTWRKVPRGTNGGMTAWGTACSVAGGAAVGLAMGVILAMENAACSPVVIGRLAGWGGFAGGFGSLVDSFLGATIQQTRYSAERRLITERDGEVINGWDMLSNNQVNVVSSAVAASVLAWLAS